MFRVRFHGRGGQGAKVASRTLGSAAFFEGYYVQDFPLYGAERRGAPITAFTRISKDPILERGVVADPDIVIVIDETILGNPQANPLSGLKESGVVFINTPHTAEEIKVKYGIQAQVITLDLTKISLDIFGKPVLSTLAGGVASRIIGLREDSLKKAVEKESSEIVADDALIGKNREAAIFCYHAVTSQKIPIVRAFREGSPVITMPFDCAVTSSPSISTTGNTPLRKTGNWRVFKPVWNYDVCTQCMTCVVRCPDGCISVHKDGFPYTDYDNCKGCLICVAECPVKAINSVREVHV